MESNLTRVFKKYFMKGLNNYAFIQKLTKSYLDDFFKKPKEGELECLNNDQCICMNPNINVQFSQGAIYIRGKAFSLPNETIHRECIYCLLYKWTHMVEYELRRTKKDIWMNGEPPICNFFSIICNEENCNFLQTKTHIHTSTGILGCVPCYHPSMFQYFK